MKEYRGSDKPGKNWHAAYKGKKLDLPKLNGDETRDEIIAKIIKHLRERKQK